MARLPPSRHPLHCSLRIPDLRARNDSPLRRSCHPALSAICLTRRLSAQTIRHCGLNATFRTRLQQCGGDWWPLSSRRSRVAHAAPLATDTEICDTVRVDGCENGGGDCTDRLLWAAAAAQTQELGLQIARLLAFCCPGALHEHGLEPRRALAQAGRSAFSGALVVTRTQAGP